MTRNEIIVEVLKRVRNRSLSISYRDDAYWIEFSGYSDGVDFRRGICDRAEARCNVAELIEFVDRVWIEYQTWLDRIIAIDLSFMILWKPIGCFSFLKKVV